MNSFAEHSDIIEVITRFLSNEADKDEISFLEKWRKETPENESLFQEYKKLWDKTDLANEAIAIDLEHEWQKFDNYIESKAQSTSINKAREFSIRPILRIAASVAVIASLTFFGWYLSKQIGAEKYLAQNEVKVIDLPDGTRVTLNHASKLQFDSDFGVEKREVTLHGEAYFEVAKDSTKPFIVNASNSVIEVLGTSFNVSAYKDKPEVEVVVNTGIVALSNKKLPDEKIILKPGDKGEFKKDLQKLNLQKNEDVNFLSWKTQKLIFENTALEDVIESLEKVYHKDFDIQSERIKKCSITTTFDQQSLKSVMLILESTLDLTIEEEKGILLVTGPGC